jgi:hypothetical protein
VATAAGDLSECRQSTVVVARRSLVSTVESTGSLVEALGGSDQTMAQIPTPYAGGGRAGSDPARDPRRSLYSRRLAPEPLPYYPTYPVLQESGPQTEGLRMSPTPGLIQFGVCARKAPHSVGGASAVCPGRRASGRHSPRKSIRYRRSRGVRESTSAIGYGLSPFQENGGYYALESTHVCNTPFRFQSVHSARGSA